MDLSHVCFRDVTWLQRIPLTTENILDYFALSQFYDRTCNNEVLKMQARYLENPNALLTQLHRMTGPEYALLPELSHPPFLFIIVRQYRSSPTQVRRQQVYYVLDGTIYQAPSLYSLLSCRLTTSLHALYQALEYGSRHIKYDLNRRRYTAILDVDENQPTATAAAVATTSISLPSFISPTRTRIYFDALNKTLQAFPPKQDNKR